MANKYSVFRDMTRSEIEGLKKCLHFNKRQFNEKDIIMQISPENRTMGIIAEGYAYLASTGINGEKTIIDFYEEGSAFGVGVLPDSESNSYYVLAKTHCKVWFTEFDQMIACCSKSCDRHLKLIDNLISGTVGRIQLHTDILSRRSIRDKLTAYFTQQSEQCRQNEFTIPLSLAELADYLAVNRSAMMREIKKMNDDGLIDSSGTSVRLIKASE
ncbi:MAG: Crp/Fnr family transcriptional regulator [Huintestinicola sp.]